jgi:DNA/RNA endonuclease G (NUC1)/6-phosphogluconolactonase (cycloisomerase 2 family)
VASFEAVLDLPAPESDPTQEPVLQGVELKFSDENGEPFAENDNEPVLFLTADNALIDTANLATSKGSRFEDLIPKFSVGNEVYEGTVLGDLSSEVSENRVTVAVKVPNTVPLGSSRISLSREQDLLSEQSGTEPVYVEVEFESNKVRLENEKEYVFTALASADSLSVVDGTNPEAVVNDTSSEDLLLGKIPVGVDGVTDRPESLAIAGDNSRIYVPLKFSGGVAVVDPITLSQVDNEPDTPDVAEPISLPDGARPQDIALGLRDEYAYIADEARPFVYVLDIDPFSDTYHEVLQTIVLETENNAGLNRLGISSDGRRLFATGKDGYIYAKNIDPLDKPEDGAINLDKWHEQIGRFETEQGAMGIASTNSSEMMTFTSGNSRLDFNGFGVLEVTNDDTLSFEVQIRYVPLGLGSTNDYFDVRQAYGVTLTKDASYAFVAGRNLLGSILDDEVLDGGNVGIIEDPLGDNPRLVAATRPIPNWLTYDLVLSNDDKYLYVSNPNLSASGDVFVFDVEEIVETLENPTDYVIDGLDRGVGSPFFDESTSRVVTEADFASVPIDDINPEISIAADYEIVLEDRPRNQFTFGVPEDSTRGPINIGGNPRAIERPQTPWLKLMEHLVEKDDFTPTLHWQFKEDGQDVAVDEISLFVSVFDEGEGLAPWDRTVDLSGPDGNEFLAEQGLSKRDQIALLTKTWNVSDYRRSRDFNPNRILTATWKRNETGTGGTWYWGDGSVIEETDETPKTFSLGDERTLTAGQEYYWGVEAYRLGGGRNYRSSSFTLDPVPPTVEGNTFSSASILTHGFKPPVVSSPGIPTAFYDLADNITDANNGGLIMRYDRDTGYWIPVNDRGQVVSDFPAGRNPGDGYKEALQEYVLDSEGNLEEEYRAKPLVLLSDWSGDNESAIPDSGFSEAAADSIFSSLVQLDQWLGGSVGTTEPTPQLYDEEGNLIRNQGALFDSPLHFIGFSRGTIVNSEIIQRLGTFFPEAGGTDPNNRDLQMTTLDPHDFNQPSLEVAAVQIPFGPRIALDYSNFFEPKVQVWEGITFADNYYQTVPDLLRNTNTFTPAGRDVPRLPVTDTYGTPWPREGWRKEFPDPDAPLLGEPDVSLRLGTNSNETGYTFSSAGFTRETDPVRLGPIELFQGQGGTHGRVLTWYDGTSDLAVAESPDALYRRRGDAYREHFFDTDFYNLGREPRFNPWYAPDHKASALLPPTDFDPAEGIGTGWFYSVLGGGKDLRPETDVERVPLDFDNTSNERMGGDYAVPTLFNGNFDAVTNPHELVRNTVSREIPGWSYHNSADSTLRRPTDNLVDWRDIPALNEPRRFERIDGTIVEKTYLEQLKIEEPNYALRLENEESITHNRFVVPDWGALRFNIHVPQLTAGEVKISIQGDAPGFQNYQELGTVNLERASGHRSDYAEDLQKIGFATQGFETFQMDIPDVLRGKTATLKFEVNNGTVYLDDVFFKSAHLKFGNPSEARYYPGLSDENTTNEDRNFLLEKPQFATSYDNSNKTPKWVSWQLNPTWLGTTGRGSNIFIEDPMIPASWGRIKEGDYQRSDYRQGHMLPSHDRQNTFKDNAATFLMTNVVPQHFDNNDDFRGETPDQGAWANFEDYLHNLVTGDTANEVYAIAGGYGSNPNPQRYSHYARTTRLTNPQILIDKGITIPEWTWKVALILDRPGQGVADVTANTPAYAILTPNGVEPLQGPAAPDGSLTNPDGSINNNADFLSPVIHPFNQLLGGNRPNIENKAQWRNWQTWRLTVNEIEELAQLDFFSNIPQPIQDDIEGNFSSVIPLDAV